MGDFRDLKVYKLSYKLAMEIFHITKKFPKEERYSLTDQIRRSSRSVTTNISESYRKRRYPKHFISKLSDSDAELAETLTWLDFSKDCEYINYEEHTYFINEYEEVGKMLGSMINKPERFIITNG
ncbi:MAG TPA: diversity-generating retroelement protein bAvd family protein [Bacteroidales bacterium]|jgi:four helix bundle protein|nr:diversity-generating retroelement protein bAvd family protein [Bacteroidales bacterium]